MSQRQWRRLDTVERIGRGTLTLGEAAEVLGLSKRQVRRLRRAVERRGREGWCMEIPGERRNTE